MPVRSKAGAQLDHVHALRYAAAVAQHLDQISCDIVLQVSYHRLYCDVWVSQCSAVVRSGHVRQIRVVFDLLRDQLALGTEAAALQLPFPVLCLFCD